MRGAGGRRQIASGRHSVVVAGRRDAIRGAVDERDHRVQEITSSIPRPRW
jgi:hypothetical protein